MNFIDYYQILGVEATASLDTIKKNFRRLAKLYHPDECFSKTPEEQAINTEKLKQIYEAYETLKDSFKRFAYDKLYYEQMEKISTMPSKEETSSPKKKQESNKTSTVKTEETFSFSKRHKNFSRNLEKNYDFGDNVFIASLEKGLLHVCGEAIYQFSKLKNYGNQATKYVLKNKYILSLSLACALAVGGANNNIINKYFQNADYNSSRKEDAKKDITLTRFYTIKKDDTLYDLSQETNISIDEIKKINNKYSDTLYIGEKIILPYKISFNDLDYYTSAVSFDNTISLEEFAHTYETTIADLITLNQNAIIVNNGRYIVLTNSLNVPNFITKKELAQKLSK